MTFYFHLVQQAFSFAEPSKPVRKLRKSNVKTPGPLFPLPSGGEKKDLGEVHQACLNGNLAYGARTTVYSTRTGALAGN